jgi:hypothetical protein
MNNNFCKLIIFFCIYCNYLAYGESGIGLLHFGQNFVEFWY